MASAYKGGGSQGPAILRNPVGTAPGGAITTPIGLQKRSERGTRAKRNSPQQPPREGYGTHADETLI